MAKSDSTGCIGNIAPRVVGCSSRRMILPLVVFGSSSMISTMRGYLYAAIRSRANALISSGVTVCPAFRLITALIVSPRYGSGTPTTAASRTAGC